MYWVVMVASMLRMVLVKYCSLIQQAMTIPGLGIESFQEDMEWDGVTLLLELISVYSKLSIAFTWRVSAGSV